MPLKSRNKDNSEREPLPQLGKKQQLILIGIIVALAVLLVARLFFGGGAAGAPDAEAALAALQNTLAADSYRFTTESTVHLSGQQRLFCRLEGEKSGENRHIAGELLGTPLNIYLTEGALYQQNGQDKSWRQIAEADLAQARKLVGEIAPETNLNYAETGPVTYEGTEEVDGQALHKFTLQPVLADNWIEQYFTDIVSNIWLDEEGQYIVRAQLNAVSSQNPAVTLVVDNTFSAFGEPLEIKAPL